MPKKINLNSLEFIGPGYTSLSSKIPFVDFTHNVNESTIHMTAGSLLVVIANDGYQGSSIPLLKFYLNQTEGTVDLGIPANSYTYLTNSITFENVVGAIVFDEKENMVLAPWAAIRGTFTEFAVLIAPSMFSFKNLNI